jgi:hypothetical protein
MAAKNYKSFANREKSEIFALQRIETQQKNCKMMFKG